MKLKKFASILFYSFLLSNLSYFAIFAKETNSKNSNNPKTLETGETFIFDLDRIYMPIDNKGVIADVDPGDGAGGKFDDITFLFSGGFYCTGIISDSVWGVGQQSSARIGDFHPGQVSSDSAYSKNLIYSVKGTDEPFNQSWQDWSDAVSLGAKFYDGDGDSIYNPVDLNSNGVWDVNEDRPDQLGDYTAWCVYNDAAPPEQRRYDVTPQGLEVRQSIFASNAINEQSDDLFIIRYELVNTGTVTDLIDSVYFGPGMDPDLGDYQDDLVGCDTLLNSGFLYNAGPDAEYGSNPPAFFVQQIQGPPAFIPGETYIDNNSDGEYTVGVDTPLDSALVRRGNYLGSEFIPGAKNLDITSFTNYMSSHPSHGDPDTHFELRNYMLGGMGKNGDPLDPCTWEFGNGDTLSNCSEINPKFMYSGDPVTRSGWLQTIPLDQRFILSSGPFRLKAGEPVELIYAYIVGRGTDHLNSITVARDIAQDVQALYDNNFEDMPTNIDDDDNLIADEFRIYQNYPNPFNPVTTIKYTIPVVETRHASSLRNVVLKIFDILGREIKTLVNEQKPAGTYEVQFDASQLSSGVYFYSLQYGELRETKKLMLLK